VQSLSRRALISAAGAALVARPASADVDPGWRPRSLEVREVLLEGTLSRRFVLGIPRSLAPGERAPLLVLLHGLGETGSERMGAWAWFERYGLGASYDRVMPTRGLVLVCPYMPLPRSAAATEDYGRWLVSTVIPRARSEAPALDSPAASYLGGCSLGGRVSLDVFLRNPESFGAWGGVQTAIGASAAAGYADRLARVIGRVGPRPILIETSSGDPFRAGNESLADALSKRGVASTFLEPPGPHDQPWLRQSGTPRMLEWFATR
jgi:enterochelin esterase-like enzyme